MVVIAASQGGVAALRALFARLPADFPVPIAVALHRTESPGRGLASLLERPSALAVKVAEEGEVPRAGTIYVAPAAQHLVLRANRAFHLMDGGRIHFARSSANPLFQSAAYSLDGRVVGIVLSGGGSNGVQGVQAIRGMGGTVIAQDPATAEAPSMPRNAIAAGAVHFVLPLDEIPGKLVSLVRAP